MRVVANAGGNFRIDAQRFPTYPIPSPPSIFENRKLSIFENRKLSIFENRILWAWLQARLTAASFCTPVVSCGVPLRFQVVNCENIIYICPTVPITIRCSDSRLYSSFIFRKVGSANSIETSIALFSFSFPRCVWACPYAMVKQIDRVSLLLVYGQSEKI